MQEFLQMSNKRWMRPAERAVEPPFFAVFRNCFQLSEPGVLRFTWSADERAQLFCDGERIADGPPRGTPRALRSPPSQARA